MKIYDCFTFFNEIKLLKIRLRILAPYVDYFVIVECDKTLRGEYKGFNLNLEELGIREYKDKIRHIKVTDAPDVQGNGQWEIEYHQRNSIMRGLYDCRQDDLVMVSDLDEIPSPTVLADLQGTKISRLFSSTGYRGKIKEFFRLAGSSKKVWFCDNLLDLLEYTPVIFRMRLFYYYMNCEARKGFWDGLVITKFKNMLIPQSLRMLRGKIPSVDGGWHFSYLGGVEKIKLKLRSIVDDTPAIIDAMDKFSSDDDYIEYCLRNGIDIYGRIGNDFEYQFIDIADIGIPDVMKIVADCPEFFRTCGKCD